MLWNVVSGGATLFVPLRYVNVSSVWGGNDECSRIDKTGGSIWCS
jgi:hypothetical protein